MDVRCPGCNLLVTVSDQTKAATLRCPRCDQSLEQAPAAASADTLFEDLLAESRRLMGRNGRNGAMSHEPTNGRSPAARKLPPPDAPASRRAMYAVILGIILITAAGFGVVMHIQTGLRKETATETLRHVERERPALLARFKSAEDARAAREYARAVEGYQEVIARSNSFLQRLRDDTAGVRGPLREKAEELDAQLSNAIHMAQNVLDIPEVKYGAMGWVEYEGTWMAPERQKALFEERMKNEGRTLHEGQWLTEAEIHELRGEILHNGQWISKAEYARLLAQNAPNLPVTTTTLAPRRRPVLPRVDTSLFDPAVGLWMINDFEGTSHEWANEVWPNINPADLSIVRHADSRRLQVAIKGGKGDKTVLVRPLGADFTSRTKLSMDITNACGEPVRIAIALKTNARPDFYESRWAALRIDANVGVTFDLRAGDFKSEATHWTHATPILKPDYIGWLYILIYHDKPGRIYFDNIAAIGE